MGVSLFLWYVQTVGCGSWYMQPNPEAHNSAWCAVRHLSLCSLRPSSHLGHSAIQSMGSTHLTLKMDETGCKKKKYLSMFQSTWCETFLFLMASHISKHHVCKLRRADFITVKQLTFASCLTCPLCRLLSRFILPPVLSDCCFCWQMMAPQHTYPLTDTHTMFALFFVM